MNFKSNLKELLVFELQSFVGRNFFRKRPILFKEKNYLNLGCGHNLIDGFVNADFFYKVWNKKIPMVYIFERNTPKRVKKLHISSAFKSFDLARVFVSFRLHDNRLMLYPHRLEFLVS